MQHYSFRKSLLASSCLVSSLSLTLLLTSSFLGIEEDHWQEEIASETAPHQISNMDTEQSAPCCERTPIIFAIGEYLCWQANVSGLELGFGRSSVEQGVVNGIPISRTSEFNIDPHFNWNSGYRAGLGMRFPDNHIYFEFLWTQYNGRGHRKVNSNSGHTKISLEQIDGMLAYNCAWPTVNVDPFFGVRGTKIKNSIKSSVTSNITILPGTSANALIQYDDHQRFEGIGPLIGLHTDWMMGKGFGIYGEIAFSVLYGNYNINFDDSSIYSAPILVQSNNRMHQHLHRFNNVLDLGLGLFWRKSFCNCFEMGISLGYEFHDYYNLSNLGSNRGDVTFNGGVVSFEIGF